MLNCILSTHVNFLNKLLFKLFIDLNYKLILSESKIDFNVIPSLV